MLQHLHEIWKLQISCLSICIKFGLEKRIMPSEPARPACEKKSCRLGRPGRPAKKKSCRLSRPASCERKIKPSGFWAGFRASEPGRIPKKELKWSQKWSRFGTQKGIRKGSLFGTPKARKPFEFLVFWLKMAPRRGAIFSTKSGPKWSQKWCQK